MRPLPKVRFQPNPPITSYYVRAFLLLPTADVMSGYAPKQQPYRQNSSTPHGLNGLLSDGFEYRFRNKSGW